MTLMLLVIMITLGILKHIPFISIKSLFQLLQFVSYVRLQATAESVLLRNSIDL